MTIPDRLRLPFQFDVDGLAQDVAGLGDLWEPHFNAQYYEGDWSGVALRSTGGAVSLYPDPHAPAGFVDTPAMDRCPHVRKALGVFACALTSVRFLRLGPGARVREHRDFGLELENGEARLHVPVVAGAAEFVLDSKPIEMKAGECWYVDVNRPHRVANAGPDARVHLVVDCVVDDWLRGVLEHAASPV